MRKLLIAAVSMAALCTPAFATTFTWQTPGVGSAINSDGFSVATDPYSLWGSAASVNDNVLTASDKWGAYPLPHPVITPTYSDAGWVLYWGGGMTLGQLGSVSVDSSGSPLAVNLWLDTSGDGSFFGMSQAGGVFSSLNGDTYAGCGAPALTGTSSCYILGGNGAGQTLTFADLQAEIDPSTPVALWIGVTHTEGGPTQEAVINSVTVNTAAVPEPASLALLGAGLVGLGLIRRRRA